MTYFETPTDAAAYYAGMSTAAFVAREEAIEADAEALYFAGEPHLDPEDRTLIPEDMVTLVSEQDRADLDLVLAWEEFAGFHNP